MRAESLLINESLNATSEAFQSMKRCDDYNS